MELPLCIENFPFLCRVCLAGNDLNLLSEKKSLQNVFTNITDIQVDMQDNLPKKICKSCEKKLEDISAFINIAKHTNIGLLQDLIQEKEDLYSSQKDEMMITDDGVTIKIEEDLKEFDYHGQSVFNSECDKTEKFKSLHKYEIEDKEEFVRRNKYTNLFPYVCRICLVQKNLSVFNEHEYLVDLFRNITNIVVTPQDELPKNACYRCIHKLQSISYFIDSSKSNNAKLQQILSESGETKAIKMEKNNGIDITHTDKELKVMIEESSQVLNALQIKTCEECGDYFSTKEGLLNHLKVGHVTLQETETQKCDTDKWKCGLCNKDFFASLPKKKHMESHSRNGFLLCFVCGKAFIKKEEYLNHCSIHPIKGKRISDKASSTSTKKNIFDERCSNVNSRLQVDYREHVRKKPREIWEVKDGQIRSRPFQCEICHKSFLRNIHLIAHRRIHADPSFQCEICSKKFHYKQNLVTHMTSHSSERPYCCKICLKFFKTRGVLEGHFALHRGEKHFQCYICQKEFAKKVYLAVHIRVHTGERPYKCNICRQMFTQVGDMKRHNELHSTKREFQCFICLKFYPTSYRLKIHTRTHIAEKEFECTLCLKTFNGQDLLKRHVKTHTSEKLYQCHVCARTFTLNAHLSSHLKVHAARERSFKCKVCQKGFYAVNDLNRHVPIHTVDRPFKCSICFTNFPIKKYLAKHMKSKHTKREKLHQCTICSKRFHLPSALKYHQQSVHDGETRFECRFCSKKFFDRCKMYQHMRVHTSEKPYSCSQCPKRFSHKQSLTFHLRVHTGEKPFECLECHKCFNRKSHLKSHMRIHTGEQPYQCETCNRRFSHKNSLKNHLLLHSGAKPFECHQCSKTFRDTSTMKVHMRTHTGEKPFNCTICPRSFAHRSSLQIHLDSHKGEKPYTCYICSKNFGMKRYLADHFEKTHRERKFYCDICSKVFPKEGHLKMHKRMAAHRGI